MNLVITWSTHKTGFGFEYRIFTIGYNVPSVTLKTGLCSTRSIAVRQAKAWTRYFKQQPEGSLV
jgi:hypothetical protein